MISEKIETGIMRARPYLVVFWLTLTFVVALLWQNIFISIKPGEAGVLWQRFRGGTVIDTVFGEGFHVIFPWDRMAIYDVRIQSEDKEISVLTKNGLRVRIKLTIRYHPQYDMLGILHQQVGTNYLNRIVIPEVESLLRTTAGSYENHDVYTIQSMIVSKMLNQAANEVAYRFVRIDDIMIREVVLPTRIQEAIELKIEQEELALAYVYKLDREKQEAERRRIEAEGLKAANAILTASITKDLLTWRGIDATRDLAASTNSKIVVIGSGKGGMPLILNTETP